MLITQLGFGDYEQSTAKKRTRRERFLAEMEAVVPWKALIEPHYPKTSSKGGRPPYPLETMLRVHLMLQWYDLSDPAMEDALIEVATMRRSAGIALITDRIPDEPRSWRSGIYWRRRIWARRSLKP
jgi:IS5 family transposase